MNIQIHQTFMRWCKNLSMFMQDSYNIFGEKRHF